MRFLKLSVFGANFKKQLPTAPLPPPARPAYCKFRMSRRNNAFPPLRAAGKLINFNLVFEAGEKNNKKY